MFWQNAAEINPILEKPLWTIHKALLDSQPFPIWWCADVLDHNYHHSSQCVGQNCWGWWNVIQICLQDNLLEKAIFIITICFFKKIICCFHNSALNNPKITSSFMILSSKTRWKLLILPITNPNNYS